MKKLKHNIKGITLIALIITIIILLILAGISISALTKENGLWTQANNAKDKSKKSQVEEEVKLAVMTLQIEENQKEMTQDKKIKFLEDELKKQDLNSTVSIDGAELIVSHKGYEFEVDGNYNVVEAFNADEWDKTATSEDCFLWESDIEGEEGYNTIIGYTEKIQTLLKVKIPSRCKIIKGIGTSNDYSGGRIFIANKQSIELPDTITEIGTWAFINCQNLTSITIPDSVTSIGSGAFYNCTGLTNIIVPDSVTSISNSAFGNCTSLTSATIPNSVTSIGWGAFYNCTSLTNMTLPASITSIEYETFYGCTNLTSVIIPDSVTSIGDFAFYNCTSLTSVTIPDSVTSIGWDAFHNCTSLTSVTIPDSVLSIKSSSFSNVPHIYYSGTAKGSPWGALAIN